MLIRKEIYLEDCRRACRLISWETSPCTSLIFWSLATSRAKLTRSINCFCFLHKSAGVPYGDFDPAADEATVSFCWSQEGLTRLGPVPDCIDQTLDFFFISVGLWGVLGFQMTWRSSSSRKHNLWCNSGFWGIPKVVLLLGSLPGFLDLKRLFVSGKLIELICFINDWWFLPCSFWEKLSSSVNKFGSLLFAMSLQEVNDFSDILLSVGNDILLCCSLMELVLSELFLWSIQTCWAGVISNSSRSLTDSSSSSSSMSLKNSSELQKISLLISDISIPKWLFSLSPSIAARDSNLDHLSKLPLDLKNGHHIFVPNKISVHNWQLLEYAITTCS